MICTFKAQNCIITFQYLNFDSIFIQVKNKTVSYFNSFYGYFW